MAQTASMLAIGDELLSGRTKDRNIGHLADVLTLAGIDLKEVRIVGDEPDTIAHAVNALRAGTDHVFTSGGIGPTHDDMTADAVGLAFGLSVDFHPEAWTLLENHYRDRGMEFTPARQRMARTPAGATLIPNAVSVAPGFSVANVHVMAGVPAVFQAMLQSVVATLPQGQRIMAASVACPLGEGEIGGPLAQIQHAHPDVVIGSYPKFDGGGYSTELVVRSRDADALERARAEVARMVERQMAQRS